MNQFFIDLLKQVSNELGTKNDEELAARLEVPRLALARLRTGTARMDERVARYIASLLEEDEDAFVMRVAAASTTDSVARDAYLRLAEQMLGRDAP